MIGGAVWILLVGGEGGTNGTFDGGIVVLDVGVAGEEEDAVDELGFGVTRPGGAGSFVAGLAEPGSTVAFESVMLGFCISEKAL